MKSRMLDLLHKKSASDFDGTNSTPRERIFKYASPAMPISPAFSNILKLSHFDRLINFLATPQLLQWPLLGCFHEECFPLFFIF